jgi:transglutaminase-like putative cysteine protease
MSFWMRKSVLFSIPLLALAVVLGYWFFDKEEVESPNLPTNRVVKYSVIVKNPGADPIRNARFWVYAPYALSAYQALVDIKTSHPYHLETDASGNQRLVFGNIELPPYASKTYSITARLSLYSSPNTLPAIDKEHFLIEEPYIEIGDERIKRLADRLHGESSRQTAANIYYWVISNIKKRGYQARNNGAVRTLMTKTGDCTEAMYLFSALSRASGIPSRNLAGFRAKESGLLKSRNYHNWVEILIDGKWQLVDPDKRIFMDRETDYIAMSVLGGVEVNGFPEKQRFFAGTDNITLTMN